MPEEQEIRMYNFHYTVVGYVSNYRRTEGIWQPAVITLYTNTQKYSDKRAVTKLRDKSWLKYDTDGKEVKLIFDILKFVAPTMNSKKLLSAESDSLHSPSLHPDEAKYETTASLSRQTQTFQGQTSKSREGQSIATSSYPDTVV